MFYFLNFFCSTLYNKELATIPILAEKLTIELVHHIEVRHCLGVSSPVDVLAFNGWKFDFTEISPKTGRADRRQAEANSDGARPVR